MKLQKLIIENIASIEKACIDFEYGPLGEDSIFLICGPTGAGKSTLLDAVCLALYNTTPRLKQAANERYLDESDSFSGTGEVSIDDSRMLMRRDSVSAQVELWFADAAGDALRAVWSVARARNKAGGKIQKVVWTLSLQDGTPLTNKSTETRMEIERRRGKIEYPGETDGYGNLLAHQSGNLRDEDRKGGGVAGTEGADGRHCVVD